MQWERITPPALYGQDNDALAKEHGRLIGDIADVNEKRTAADALDPVEHDRGADRSQLLSARIAALEAENAVRQRIIVFNLAMVQFVQEARHRAQAALLDVEMSLRQKLCIPDSINAVPPAVRQNSAAWWKARVAVERVGDVDCHRDNIDHQRCMMSADDTLKKLRQALSVEPARLARMRAAEDREVQFQMDSLRASEERRRPANGIQEQVEELLSRT